MKNENALASIQNRRGFYIILFKGFYKSEQNFTGGYHYFLLCVHHIRVEKEMGKCNFVFSLEILFLVRIYFPFIK